MQKRYLKGKHISEATFTLMDSGTWKWIIQSKEKAMQVMTRKLSNGQNTMLWHDTWLQGGKLLTQVSIAPKNTFKISDIVENNSWHLKDPDLNQVWNRILQHRVPDIHAQGSDSWQWSLTESGEFSFRSACDKIRCPGSKFMLYDLIWFPNHSPKMSTCLLRAVTDKLPTRAFLKALNIIDADNCVQCNLASETLQHLFFECSSSYIWKLCKMKLVGSTDGSVGTLVIEAKKIQSTFIKRRNSTMLVRTALCATFWHIWKGRGM